MGWGRPEPSDRANLDHDDIMGAILMADRDYSRALEHLDNAARMLTGDEPADQYVGIHSDRAMTLDILGWHDEAVRCLNESRDCWKESIPGTTWRGIS